MPSMAHCRRMAIGAARSEIRRRGDSVKGVSADDALKILDDLSRTDPKLEAVYWYEMATDELASDNQIKLFKREWKQGGIVL
jgi:hypothetical protein